jgi:diguanylate cyclase (GGDEF)-like protein/PAS domain S-box-containing protein
MTSITTDNVVNTECTTRDGANVHLALSIEASSSVELRSEVAQLCVAASAWFVETDATLRIVQFASPVASSEVPFVSDWPMGFHLADAIHFNESVKGSSNLSQRLEAHEPVRGHFFVVRHEVLGSQSYELTAIPRHNNGGCFKGYWGLVRNVTAMRSLSQQQQQQATLINSVFDNSPSSIVIRDLEGKIVRCNPRAIELAVAREQSTQGVIPKPLPSERSNHVLSATDEDVLTNEKPCETEISVVQSDGLHTYLATTFPMFDPDGTIVGLGSIGTDITELKRAETALYQKANFDELTGLPNRRHFREKLSDAVCSARERNEAVVLIVLELDNFATINDTMGTLAGDELLIEATWRLKNAVPKSAIVGRVAGDGFGVALSAADTNEELNALVAALRAAFDLPCHVQGVEVFTGATMGLATFPELAGTADSLYRHANLAMGEACKNGYGAMRKFNAEMGKSLERKARIDTLLRLALAKNELSLNYQPLINPTTGHVEASEALIRWNNPELGAVGPDQFIPIAEQTGLIHSIGRWVMATACAEALRWQRPGRTPISVSVNVSPTQLSDSNFADVIVQILGQTGLPPELLKIEITESGLMGDVKQTKTLLERLKKIGVQLSLDDFGTGYSSLSHLKHFPFDILKLDRAFIRLIQRDGSEAELTESIIHMAQALDMSVVAEGVEDLWQVEFLKRRKCDLIQGYVYSKPLRGEDFLTYVENRNRIVLAA